MLSKNKIAFLHSLKLKKFRDMNKLFLAEGSKLILDLLNSSFEVKEIYATGSWIREHEQSCPGHIPVFKTTEAEMERITALSSPSPVLAVVAINPQCSGRKRYFARRGKVADSGDVIQDGDIYESEQPPAPLAKARQR